jgi:hypothetical protein
MKEFRKEIDKRVPYHCPWISLHNGVKACATELAATSKHPLSVSFAMLFNKPRARHLSGWNLLWLHWTKLLKSCAENKGFTAAKKFSTDSQSTSSTVNVMGGWSTGQGMTSNFRGSSCENLARSKESQRTLYCSSARCTVQIPIPNRSCRWRLARSRLRRFSRSLLMASSRRASRASSSARAFRSASARLSARLRSSALARRASSSARSRRARFLACSSHSGRSFSSSASLRRDSAMAACLAASSSICVSSLGASPVPSSMSS